MSEPCDCCESDLPTQPCMLCDAPTCGPCRFPHPMRDGDLCVPCRDHLKRRHRELEVERAHRAWVRRREAALLLSGATVGHAPLPRVTP